jgi:type IV pilus assembly protein PilE
MAKPNASAFTMLELVVALAIVATLAAFAVPAYHRHVARAYRTDAAAALYRAAQFVESAVRADSAALPPGLDQSPQSGAPAYKLRLLPADDTNGGYTLEAQPADTGPMRDDACGVFVLDATGSRTNRGNGGGNGRGSSASPPQSDDCWKGR